MARYDKQPLYVYDEPITYEALSGGINNDPSNSNIEDTELRDAINVTYNNRTLEKRLGAKLFKQLRFHETNPSDAAGFVQMQSIFTAPKNTYYIVIRDGHLFYSQLDVVNEEFMMVEVPIYLSNEYFDGTMSKFDPQYVVHSLDVYEDGNEPNPLLEQEGYVLHQVDDKNIDYPFTEEDDSEDTGIFIPGNTYRLVLQNYRSIESIVHNDTMFVATGTRYLKIREVFEDDKYTIKAEIVRPKKIMSWEYGNIGFNYLSPYPEQAIYESSILNTAQVSNIVCGTHYPFKGNGSATFKAVMDYHQGMDITDYYFKWEVRDITNEGEWTTLVEFINGKGVESYELDLTDYMAGDIISLRVTFTNDYFEDPDTKETIDMSRATTGKVATSFTIEEGTSSEYEPVPSQNFLEIHSCNKILADGNKVILYGAQYNSGGWYKSVLETNPQFDYFSDTGQLDFQTNKNERLIKCIHLEGNIVVFADNEHLGGSIHVVYGNGDDYQGDQYFSPYKRKQVHSSISCDHPNSVQYVENYILFKYRTTIWLLDSRELNSERVKLVPVNTRINHANPALPFPDIKYSPRYESELFSYVSDECYTLVFPQKQLRWKMYFKQALRYENENTMVFPWLRDLSPILDVKGTFSINNVQTYLTSDFKLVQFNNHEYKDLDEEYKMRIVTKAWDLTYKNIVKFVNSIQLNYSRGNTAVLKLNLYGYNESAIKILGPKSEAFVDKYTHKVVYANKDNYYDEDAHEMDKPSLLLNTTNLGATKIGTPYFSSKLFHPARRFPLINAAVIIETSSPESFSLGSLTFNYITTDIPPKTLPKLYSEIIREEF